MKDLSDEPMWSYESVRSINSQARFTHFDYARVLRQSLKIDQDTLVPWLRSYAPPLVEHAGRVYLTEQFSVAELEDVRRRVSGDSDAQLFMNLVNISDLLGQELDAQVPTIAAQIAENLNARIKAEFPLFLDRAKTLIDEGEHYVSIVRTAS